MQLTKKDLKEFLDDKVEKYNTLTFITSDPIQIPHKFKLKQDIEIAAFLTSTIAWGQIKIIIKNAKIMMENLDNSPYEFIKNSTKKDIDNNNQLYFIFS